MLTQRFVAAWAVRFEVAGGAVAVRGAADRSGAGAVCSGEAVGVGAGSAGGAVSTGSVVAEVDGSGVGAVSVVAWLGRVINEGTRARATATPHRRPTRIMTTGCITSVSSASGTGLSGDSRRFSREESGDTPSFVRNSPRCGSASLEKT
ncbi:hypothetical protein AFL01nite_27800 [Aeromicrobium flavum]|uniref:Uncharacterized protein n=1 Tax=Aeromicrobium flavum TaxID=416568 RepID=A0A512HYC2_9ACTN|nr:hypothetical protein AFL01nite_27800 [Aeromicrobium flavum]